MISIDAPPRIAETLIVSLTCIDGRQGKGLRGVKWSQKFRVEAIFKGLRRFVVCNPYPVRLLSANSLPIGLNRISWKRFLVHVLGVVYNSLPIGLNRISWKLICVSDLQSPFLAKPYRLG